MTNKPTNTEKLTKAESEALDGLNMAAASLAKLVHTFDDDKRAAKKAQIRAYLDAHHALVTALVTLIGPKSAALDLIATPLAYVRHEAVSYADRYGNAALNAFIRTVCGPVQDITSLDASQRTRLYAALIVGVTPVERDVEDFEAARAAMTSMARVDRFAPPSIRETGAA